MMYLKPKMTKSHIEKLNKGPFTLCGFKDGEPTQS